MIKHFYFIAIFFLTLLLYTPMFAQSSGYRVLTKCQPIISSSGTAFKITNKYDTIYTLLLREIPENNSNTPSWPVSSTLALEEWEYAKEKSLIVLKKSIDIAHVSVFVDGAISIPWQFSILSDVDEKTLSIRINDMLLKQGKDYIYNPKDSTLLFLKEQLCTPQSRYYISWVRKNNRGIGLMKNYE